MCGITGYIGNRSAVETALTNLKRLEYRGYDSAGIAYPNCTQIQVVRAPGKIANLEKALTGTPHESRAAIAHTRWATHGRPSEDNAHPHRDNSGRVAVVHNGIIENYASLRRELIAQGCVFTSETDTETLAHLFGQLYFWAEVENPVENAADRMAQAIRDGLKRVHGSYAIAVLLQDAPDTVFVARKDSPLVIGLGEGENFLASDIPAVMRYTRRVILLEDGDVATITPELVTVTNLDGMVQNREPLDVTWDDAAAEKGGYPHFMLKEIHEGAAHGSEYAAGAIDRRRTSRSAWRFVWAGAVGEVPARGDCGLRHGLSCGRRRQARLSSSGCAARSKRRLRANFDTATRWWTRKRSSS